MQTSPISFAARGKGTSHVIFYFEKYVHRPSDLACVQKSPVSFVATKEIGDVCTQANPCQVSKQNCKQKAFPSGFSFELDTSDNMAAVIEASWCSCLLVILFGGTKAFGEEIYTNSWAVKVRGSPREAKRLAQTHGFSYDKHVRTLNTKVL